MKPAFRDAIILTMFGLLLGSTIVVVIQNVVVTSLEQQASLLP
jgi:hypothetical protein